jgi:PAS domain S-box-containing protein
MNQVNLMTDARAALYSRLFSSDFLDQLRMGIAVIDNDGVLIDCNTAAVEMLGEERDDLIGRSPFVNPVNRDGSPIVPNDHPVARVLRSGSPCLGEVVGIKQPGRSQRWLWVDSYPLIVDGRVEGGATCFQDISDQLKNLHLLELNAQVSQVVMSATSEDASLRALCDVLVAHGPYALAWIGYLADDNRGDVNVAFVSGLVDFPFDGMISTLESRVKGRGPVGTALRTGSIQVVNDLPNDSLYRPWRKRAAQFGLGSCVAIPFTPGERRAVVAIYDHHTFTFDETVVRGLEALVRESELAIAHAKSLGRLSDALGGTLAALGQMTETRDPYTAGHQRRVSSLGASLAASIAAAYGLSDEMVKLIRQSGEVHDIGKIAIPSEILTRPGRLSPLEYEMVKQHTLVGYDILSKASLPWPIAEVALQHHERVDGSGYPSGLEGEEIILPARIVAVADVVEAMTQHRPYRPGLGLESALAEVADGAGRLFDADVVAACLSVFESGYRFEDQYTGSGQPQPLLD